jgi:hypothetical protein
VSSTSSLWHQNLGSTPNLKMVREKMHTLPVEDMVTRKAVPSITSALYYRGHATRILTKPRLLQMFRRRPSWPLKGPPNNYHSIRSVISTEKKLRLASSEDKNHITASKGWKGGRTDQKWLIPSGREPRLSSSSSLSRRWPSIFVSQALS